MSTENLQYYPVSSSQINEIAFDKKEQKLYVRFHNNSLYSYPYTFEEFHNFLNAPSVGKYFHANIKNSINATKISNG